MVNNVWFTSDTHLGHSRVIEYSRRPFANSQEMDEKILSNFNSVLKPGDRLYHLGDVCWSNFDINRWLDRLNCGSVYLIEGNHDRSRKFAHRKLVYDKPKPLAHITIANSQIELCHYPLASWNGWGHGVYHLYGHVHGKFVGRGRSLDVGVDSHNFFPWSWEEIVDFLKERKITNNVS